jgi:lipoate-protein ligase B
MDLTVVDFVTALEEVMIQTVADWGIEAVRNQMNRGIWIGDCKLGSIGIAVRRGVSFHGFALNVNTALKPFDWINPCGLAGVKMTSMKQILLKPLDLNRVYKSVKRHLQDVFDVELIKKNLLDLPFS